MIFETTRRRFRCLKYLKTVIVCFVFLGSNILLGETGRIEMVCPKGMTRSDLYYNNGMLNPKGVLVFAPGENGSGESFVSDEMWKAFATENDLGLVGLAFSSPRELLKLNLGYFDASCGSGKVLVDGVRAIYGRDLPIYLYGVSGGAHFVAGFVRWQPRRIIAWCAYSARFWPAPTKSAEDPPGIIACGTLDAERYNASLWYFMKGRALGKRWTWVSLLGVGHQRATMLEDFIRSYFFAVRVCISGNSAAGEWRDIYSESIVNKEERAPCTSSWLPDSTSAERWRILNDF